MQKKTITKLSRLAVPFDSKGRFNREKKTKPLFAVFAVIGRENKKNKYKKIYF